MEDKIIEVLSNIGEPMKSGEIAEATGLQKADVDKAIKILKSQEKITSPKRCYYTVK